MAVVVRSLRYLGLQYPFLFADRQKMAEIDELLFMYARVFLVLRSVSVTGLNIWASIMIITAVAVLYTVLVRTNNIVTSHLY